MPFTLGCNVTYNLGQHKLSLLQKEMSVVQQQKHKGARPWKAALPSHRHGSSAQPLHTFTLCWRQHTQGCKGKCIEIKTCLFFFFLAR